MTYSKLQLWERFQRWYSVFPSLGLSVDLSRMNMTEEFVTSMEPHLNRAFSAMSDLERGAIANPDEKRMVGHYWLRNPRLAPTPIICAEIETTLTLIESFASEVHTGKISGSTGIFKNILLIGIGGSALGPQFVSNALSNPATDKAKLFALDNTDPDGIDRIFSVLADELEQTLCVVISKSGGTKETRNGMLEAKAAYERKHLSFGKHAVAVTQEGSDLDKYALENSWLKRFPMWDWVGGRTSELSAVGLLPAALQGFDIKAILQGAKECDALTRIPSFKSNPAAQLALAWYFSGNGKGQKNMVILPYKDRLELFSKYLQQLIMESLGKEKDLSQQVVHQGICVFGNKGSTDQHSYVQQLRDGISNFFVTFIEVLKDGNSQSIEVEPLIHSGDFLSGFFLGTRKALFENDRESLTITIPEVSPYAVGILIALFERAVGLYASLINVNAYHQPGVEAGKRAAAEIIQLQLKILALLQKNISQGFSAQEIAERIDSPQEIESVFKICEHLSANPHHGILKTWGTTVFNSLYFAK